MSNLGKPSVERIELGDKEAFEEIERFACEEGLPFFPPVMDNLLAQFIIRDPEKRICAVARLEYMFGRPFVEEVAVREGQRNRGLGMAVVGAVIDEAQRRGMETIWAMARAPAFFRKLGFANAPEMELLSQLLNECSECRDFRSVCNPELLKKKLKNK